MKAKVLFVAFCFIGANALAQDVTNGKVNIQWGTPQQVFYSTSAQVHSAERLTLLTSNEVCRNHVHRTEDRGWWIFSQTVIIDHHDPQPVSALKLTGSFIDVQNGAPVNVITISASSTAIVVPDTNDPDMDHKFDIVLHVPNLDAYIRGKSHGEYYLQMLIDPQDRYDKLAAALLSTKKSFKQIEDAFCQHLLARFSVQLSDLLIRHVQKFYPPGVENVEMEKIYKLAIRLDPQSSKAVACLGDFYIRTGQFDVAQRVLADAVKAAKALVEQNASQDNFKTLGIAARAFGLYYLEVKKGLTPGDLSRASTLLAESVTAFEKSGDTVEQKKSLLLQASILTRIRSVDALAQAVVCYNKILNLLPIELD